MTIPYADLELHPDEEPPLPESPRSGAVIVYVLLALLGVGLGLAVWAATR